MRIPARILLVEDEQALLESLAEILQLEGHEVVAVADGVTAWQAVERRRAHTDGMPFDLVISDICLPGLDGVQLQRRISEQIGPIPVIFITGQDVSQSSGADRESGTFLLFKPFDLAILLHTVEAVLESIQI
jgi:DNA-binding response OmpR family regulator